MKSFLLKFFAVAGTLSSFGEKPNILFIFSDDHAQHAISAYGSQINQTPHIDRIAAEGAIFRKSFCANSICGPSRACILTGKHSHKNGFLNNEGSANSFDGTQPHVAKYLRESGYTTAVIGKWHLVTDPTGFDYWEIVPGQGAYYNPDFYSATGKRRIEGYNTEIVADLSLEWLEKNRGGDKPFFLMCQFKAPHRNWMPGPKQLGLYKDVKIPEPATLFADHAGKSSAWTYSDMSIEKTMTLPSDLKVTGTDGQGLGEFKRMNPEQQKAWNEAYAAENEAFRAANLQGRDLVSWKYQRYIKDYLRCIASVDENIGRLLNYLDETGLAKNTIVIYSSDQGFYLGDRGWFDKRWMYEESLSMPLIWRWPGVVKPGLEINQMVQNIDYAPTWLDIVGQKIPADMQGRSFLPLLKGEKPEDWRDSLYYAYYEYPGSHMVPRHEGVRTERYKLMHFWDLDEWEFYDLQKDPGEVTNLYGDPKAQEQVAKLKTELARLKKQYDAPEHEVKPMMPKPR